MKSKFRLFAVLAYLLLAIRVFGFDWRDVDESSVLMDSPQFPSRDVLEAGLDIQSIRAQLYPRNRGTGVKTVNEVRNVIEEVPAALWRGGCTPTALSMLIMFYQAQGIPIWDAMGHTIDTFDFVSEANQELIASERHMSDFFYPTDPEGQILQDRSSEPYYTVLNLFRYNQPRNIGGAETYDFPENDCMADILHSSFSSDGLGQGMTRMLEPLYWLPQWMEQNVAGLTVKSEFWLVPSSLNQRNPDPYTNPWERLKEEIDAGRPVCGIVNATRWDIDINHNVIIVGYSEENGAKYYCCRNTWVEELEWYRYELPYFGSIFGVYGFFTYEFIAEAVTEQTFSDEKLYKFYHPPSQSYFFTSLPAEVAYIQNELKDFWKFQGPAFHVESKLSENNAPVHRFVNKQTGGHFYTANESERLDLIQNQSELYQYEGVVFYARTEPGKPFFRYHLIKSESANLDDYVETLYLEDWDERSQYLLGEKYLRKDRAWYHHLEDGFYYSPSKIIYYPNGLYNPVHRFFLSASQSHYYTSSEGEKEYLIKYGDENHIQYQGIAWYAEPIIDDGSPFDEYEGDPFVLE